MSSAVHGPRYGNAAFCISQNGIQIHGATPQSVMGLIHFRACSQCFSVMFQKMKKCSFLVFRNAPAILFEPIDTSTVFPKKNIQTFELTSQNSSWIMNKPRNSPMPLSLGQRYDSFKQSVTHLCCCQAHRLSDNNIDDDRVPTLLLLAVANLLQNQWKTGYTQVFAINSQVSLGTVLTETMTSVCTNNFSPDLNFWELWFRPKSLFLPDFLDWLKIAWLFLISGNLAQMAICEFSWLFLDLEKGFQVFSGVSSLWEP